MPIQGKACTGSFMGRLSFARTPDPQFVLHSHVHVMSSGRVVTALESCAKGFVFTNTNDSNVGGAVKTRIGPDMCARRRGRVFLDVFQHTEPHTSERVTTRQVSGFQSDLAEDTCSRTNCAQPFAVEGYALGPSV